MKISYDSEIDALYIRLIHGPQECRTIRLNEDIWLWIDHNDPEALEQGVEFKRAYNEKAAAFDQVASELSALIQQYTSVRLEETEQTGGDDREQNERLIAELNRDEPHGLTEDFTYKRPHG
ncbi:MAG: DUF2283 domain-containing protein, partial [Planctomycetia bacterium]|nr:DUF2283 domain-containing protein [Planctomycetia bacterium]